MGLHWIGLGVFGRMLRFMGCGSVFRLPRGQVAQSQTLSKPPFLRRWTEATTPMMMNFYAYSSVNISENDISLMVLYYMPFVVLRVRGAARFNPLPGGKGAFLDGRTYVGQDPSQILRIMLSRTTR